MVARSLRGGAAVITCGQNPDSILYVLKEIAYNIIGCKSKLKHKKQKNEKIIVYAKHRKRPITAVGFFNRFLMNSVFIR